MIRHFLLNTRARNEHIFLENGVVTTWMEFHNQLSMLKWIEPLEAFKHPSETAFINHLKSSRFHEVLEAE